MAPAGIDGRLLASSLFAVALLSVALGYAFGSPALRVIGVFGGVWFGVGAAPLAHSRNPRLGARAGFAGVFGLSTVTLVASVMVLAPFWHPLLVAILVGGATVALHVAGASRALAARRLTRHVMRLPPRRPRRTFVAWLAAFVAWLLMVIGTALWLGAAIASKHIVPGNWGFLPTIHHSWYAGVALVVIAIVLARRAREPAVIAPVVSLFLALTLTPALVYGMPEVQSAVKHVEVVQTILHQHRLYLSAGIYDAYSGFFSMVAWACSLAGVRDSLGIATFWPAIVGLFGLAELGWLFGALTRSRYRLWAAVTLVLLSNSLGTDYFAPQSVAYVLSLGVYALVVDRDPRAVGGWLRDITLVLAGCAIAVTHELTPFIVGGVLVVLAVMRYCRPRWAALAMLLPAGLWALANRGVLKGFIQLSDLGNLGNFRPPSIVTVPGLVPAHVTVVNNEALLVGLLVLVGLAAIGWARHIRTRWAWALALSPAVGLVFIAFNPYGNEGIFRATLFGIPWLAALAMGAPRAQSRRWVAAVFAVGALVMMTSYLIGTFSLDGFNVVRPADVAALRSFEAQAPPGSYFVELGEGDYPQSEADTLKAPFNYISWQSLLGATTGLGGPPTAADVVYLAHSLESYARKNTGPGHYGLYVVWSPVQRLYSVDFALMSAGDANLWLHLLRTSPLWKVTFASDGTYVLRLSIPSNIDL